MTTDAISSISIVGSEEARPMNTDEMLKGLAREAVKQSENLR
jgi:hypothetical protein